VEAWWAVVVLVAGICAGTINAIVGSGTLITFPVLLALGVPPVTANVSNTLGLVSGSLSGAWGYRRELTGTGPVLTRLLPATLTGAVIGAALLLRLPARAFEIIVPVLIAMALVLVVVQPRLGAAMAARRERDGSTPSHGGLLAVTGTLLIGVYGGYFGAAQGVLLLGLLGLLLAADLQRVNGIKNTLAAVANGVAALTFLALSPGTIDWRVVVLLALGSTAGGGLGALIARRLPPLALRTVIVVVGVAALLRLLVES
jgi:uncharacterized membrane protein YfcA